VSDENEENSETGAGDGGFIPATSAGIEYAIEHDVSTTPQVGHASDGGDFLSPNPHDNEGGEGNTRRASAPSERGSANSENNVSEEALTERARLAAENIRTQEAMMPRQRQGALWYQVYCMFPVKRLLG
jgi:hypothetical protein